MNAKTLVFILVTCLALIVSSHAVKVEYPGQAERESSLVLTGTVTAIYSKTTRDGRYEQNHYVATVRVESIQKGGGLKAGDLAFVRYSGAKRGIGKGELPPPGFSNGHSNVPSEGERRKVCLNKHADGGLDVYYVSGFQPADDKQP